LELELKLKSELELELELEPGDEATRAHDLWVSI
jgi:hypothetical protein